jgi:hypothetical protein
MTITTIPERLLPRRGFLMLAGAAAGSAILAACGGSKATDTPKPVAATVAPTTAAAPTSAAASAAVATRPTGSAAASTTAGSAAVSTTAPAATTAVGSAAVVTRPAGSAVASSVSATTASGSAVASAGGIQTVVIEAFDYGYKTLGSLPGGLTRVQMKNTGKEDHQAQFMLLNAGVSLDQLGAAFQKGPDAAFGLVSLAGGPGAAAPGGASEVILDLKEGQYMIACFIPSPTDHLPHLAKGMLMPFKVTTAPAAAAPAPAVNGAITLFDFNFTMPDTLPAGRSMYTVTNTGAQFHEFAVNQLLPGKTADDFKAFFDAPPTAPPSGPPPSISAGGMQALTKGVPGTVVLDLKPGNYVAACNVPDQSKPNGDSHLHLGMMKAFTVK